MAAARTPTHSLTLVVYITILLLQTAEAASSPAAIFVFGDSTVDVGNNNFLPLSKAKVNFPPYGIDFVRGRATGRFSNGLNTADFLAKKMGFKRSPEPFLSLSGNRLWRQSQRRGISFASGASGILEITGRRYYQYISMGKQIGSFETVIANLTAKMGTLATDQLLSNSVFLISAGSNDLFDSFLANGPLNETQRTNFIAILSSTYKNHLRELYNLGARKFALISIPPIGCCPATRSLNASGGCIDDLNLSAQKFHLNLEAMLKDLSCELIGMKYALGNSYQMVVTFFENPIPFGFTELKSACCGGGKFNGESPCMPSSRFCSNRNQYLFWDLFHPTQAASKLAAETLYNGSEEFVTPMNFRQLVELAN